MSIMDKSQESYDVVVVGAGISGINFGYRLQKECPNLSYTILDGRDAIGGTWDLFKYPGIRSDSDLYTFGFPWRPWTEQTAIAEGPLIVNYVKESAAMYGIDKKVQFRHKVNSANWSSGQQRWSLDVSADGKPKIFNARFMLLCTGYYNYDEPLATTIPGIENFGGKVVHPQFWPQDLDYSKKDMVIIGSGATAVTLLPALAQKAKHVTMLQRSPSYVLSQPATDGLEILIRKTCPTALAHKLIRWKWVLMPFLIVQFCHYLPNLAKKLFRGATVKQLPPSIAHDPHFKPSYNPFEQRVCFCPDGDFYAALRAGTGSIETGIIEQVTRNSIKLKSGAELHPDIIVTATGLKLRIAGGMSITLDGAPYDVPSKFFWKTCMLQDLPNAFYVIGYVDASWTLGADATAQLTCRILNKMGREGSTVAVPRMSEDERKGMKILPTLRLSSTYVQKAQVALPKTGNAWQWRPRSSYLRDIWEAWYGDIKTGVEYMRAAV